MNRQLPIYGPITEAQQRRMDESDARVQRLRVRANVIWLQPESANEEGVVNCAKCRYLGNFRAERQGGWCMALRRMVSTWHPLRCDLFKVVA